MFEAKKTGIQFSLKPAPDTKEVCVAGTFNEWVPAKMRKQKDGRFALSLKLPPGAYEYRFVVDGHWMTDPDHNQWKANPHGSFNSVAKIEG